MARFLSASLLSFLLASLSWAQEPSIEFRDVGAGAVRLVDEPGAACRKAPTKRCILDLALAAAESARDSESSRWAYFDVASALIAAGDVDAALETVERVGNVGQYSQIFDAAIEAKIAARDITAILASAAKIEDGWQRTSALIEIAEKSAAEGRPELARQALQAALVAARATIPSAARAHAATQAAETAAAIGDVETASDAIVLALATARMPVTPAVRAQTLGDVAAAQAIMGDTTMALKTAQKIDDTALRSFALTRVAAAQANAGDTTAATDIAESIEEPAARASAFLRIARTQDATGNRAAAKENIRKALATAMTIESPEKRAWLLTQIANQQPAPTGLREMRQSAAKSVDRIFPRRVEPILSLDPEVTANAITAALAAAQMIEDMKHRAQSLARIAELQIAMGDLAAALATAEIIEDESKTEFTGSRTAAGVVEAGSETGFWATTGARDQVLGLIAEAQADAGNVQSVQRTTGKIPDPYMRIQALSRLSESRAAAGQVDMARAIIQPALIALDDVETDVQRYAAAKDIAAAQATLGDTTAAIAIAEGIKNEDHRVDALMRVARVLRGAATIASVNSIEHPFVRTMVFATLAKQRAALHDTTGASHAIAAALVGAKGIPDAKARAMVLLWISEAQVAVGDVNGVRETIGSVTMTATRQNEAQLHAFQSSTIAEAQAHSGEFLDALATAEAIDDPLSRAKTLVRIANALPD